MKSKIIQAIFFFLFIAIFSYFYGNQYIQFHTEKQKTLEYNNTLEELKNNFTLESITQVDELNIYQTPNIDLLDSIVKKIENSSHRVYLETYILTEKRIQSALKKAHKKGVDVQVVLEKNPYKAYNINNKSHKNLSGSGVTIAWSDSQDFSLNHSKFIIIDDEFYISTGNFSYSTFKYNRDYFLHSQDEEILEVLLSIFENDFAGNKKNFYHNNIVLSPYNARRNFETLFHGSQESIQMYFQYFKDEQLVNTLIDLSKKGIQIEAVIPKTAIKSNADTLIKMKNAGITFYTLQKEKMHSKMILIDGKYGFIGSINFSSYSLDKNRELGLVFTNKDIIEQLENYFKKDKQKSLKNNF